MTSGTKHHGSVRQEKPISVIYRKIARKLADEGIIGAGKKHADREPGRVGCGRNEVESPQRSKGSFACQIEI